MVWRLTKKYILLLLLLFISLYDYIDAHIYEELWDE